MEWSKVLSDSNWWLAIIAALTGCVVVWQAFETHRAAGAAKSAAEAALMQSRHLEEQTKLLVDSVAAAQEAAEASNIQARAAMGTAIPTLILTGFGFADARGGFETILQDREMRVVVKNCGQTPAILKTYGLKYSCEGLSRSDAIPVAWVFEDGEIIEPGKEYTLKDAVYQTGEPFTQEEITAIAGGRKTLSVGGCLRFGDVFDSPIRELRFCKDLMSFGSDLRSSWVDSDLGIQFGAWAENRQKPRNPN